MVIDIVIAALVGIASGIIPALLAMRLRAFSKIAIDANDASGRVLALKPKSYLSHP